MKKPQKIIIRDFGLTDYETVWQFQKELVEQRQRGEIPDTLLMGEHPPVITLGRGTHAENLLKSYGQSICVAGSGFSCSAAPG
jgi:lipoyl(octanoyl) transferase